MSRIPVGLLGFLASLAMLVSTAAGQGSQTIGQLPNLSQTQRTMGAAIDVVCPALANFNGGAGGSRLQNDSQRDLFFRCREMRNTAFVLSGGDPRNPGMAANRMDLSSDQYQLVLLGLTHDESTGLGTGAVEVGSTQARTIGNRLATVRAGATGIRITGLPMIGGGGPVALSLPEALGGLDAGAAEETTSRLGVFVNGHGSFGSRDATSREPGFDFHDAGVTAGVDYRFLPSLVAGLAFTFLGGKTSFDQNLGDVDTKSYGFALYGTYYAGPLYIDGSAAFAWNTYDTDRRIVYATGPGAGGTAAGLVVDRTARGDTDGRQYTFSVGAGYDFRVGGFTLTPTLRVETIYLEIDSYKERGAVGLDLHVKSQDLLSVQSGLGGRVAYSIGTPIAILVPQISVEWRHEFADNKRTITAKYIHDVTNTFFSLPTDDPDRDYISLGVGLSAYLMRGLSAFAHFETALALRHVTNHQFTAGLRMEF